MCLYPRLIKNPRYIPNKKNNGTPPILLERTKEFVSVGCGNCIECRKQKAREWQIRMHEELKVSKNGKFVTFTFSPDQLKKLCEETQLNECNAVATIAVRRFLERYRKKHKVSCKHWLITELGHTGTERIHLHGILFTNDTWEEIEKIWGYGQIWVGNYCTNKTVNYIIKYVTKIDTDHKDYKQIILCSRGIGANYANSLQFNKHKYKGKDTKDFYILPSGAKVSNPIYYRNKLYSEEERGELWTQKIKEQTTYVMGQKLNLSTAKGYNGYLKILKTWQEENRRMGYGTPEAEWKAKDYSITFNMLNKCVKSTHTVNTECVKGTQTDKERVTD